jgi:hypothetical protein
MTFSTQCRATNLEQGVPRYSQNWAHSIKDKLIVADNQISCGPWNIKLSEIISAHLFKVRTFFNIPYCKVLEIKTVHNCYQFGLNPWAKLKEHIPMPYSESECRMIGKPFISYSKKQKLFFLLAITFLILLTLL